MTFGFVAASGKKQSVFRRFFRGQGSWQVVFLSFLRIQYPKFTVLDEDPLHQGIKCRFELFGPCRDPVCCVSVLLLCV